MAEEFEGLGSCSSPYWQTHYHTCKWVYKIKIQSNRSFERYKARLVSKCYKQEYGIDYEQTFAAIAKMNTYSHSHFHRRILSVAFTSN